MTMDKITYVAVGGTSSAHDNGWWDTRVVSNPFIQFMDGINIIPLKNESEPFEWSTDLDGVHPISYIMGSSKRHSDWVAGGVALKYYLENSPLEDRNIISHSHGRQVVLYAASKGLKINNYIDISGPIRNDMVSIEKEARHYIKSMTHVYSKYDYMQFLGSLFDLHLGFVDHCSISDKNIELSFSVGHSGLVCNSKYYPLFISKGIIDSFLK